MCEPAAGRAVGARHRSNVRSPLANVLKMAWEENGGNWRVLLLLLSSSSLLWLSCLMLEFWTRVLVWKHARVQITQGICQSQSANHSNVKVRLSAIVCLIFTLAIHFGFRLEEPSWACGSTCNTLMVIHSVKIKSSFCTTRWCGNDCGTVFCPQIVAQHVF